MLIHLRVHRFRRGNDTCAGQTFAEQVSGLTIRYGRRSIGAGEALQAIMLVTEERREAAQGSPTPRCDYRRVGLRSWPYMTKSCSRPFGARIAAGECLRPRSSALACGTPTAPSPWTSRR
ncbi:hypothetical protein GCM10010177_75100 [Actinomadura citrea]|nr:hypothetical protein GCM10010177_75100 [Actinomadura citrea]